MLLHSWILTVVRCGLLVGAIGVGVNGSVEAQLAPKYYGVRPPADQGEPESGPEPGAIAPRPSPADVLLRALAMNPVTAPYPISAIERDGRVVLKGVVGTKAVHDAAVRIAIDSGIPFADDLVIDTAAAHDVALRRAAVPMAVPPVGPAPYPIPTYGAPGYGYPPPTYTPFGPTPGGAPGSVYPPPVFGFVDEPFLGFEPPVISYPPWWGAMSARRLADPRSDADVPRPAPFPPLPGTVDMTIDPRGVATLRGTVPSLADRIAIGQRLARTPGVSEVINLLNVARATDPNRVPELDDDLDLDREVRPPLVPHPDGVAPGNVPPDVPDPRPNALPPPGPKVAPPVPDRGNPLAAVPELEGLPIRLDIRNGVAILEGDVPTVTEAMLAYLAVKRHPGVIEVIDRLRFNVPGASHRNPLLTHPDRRDVEAYLLAQVRRQLDGQAQVHRVRVIGDRLEIEGTLRRADDLPRVEAILRSTPVLRGFELTPEIQVDRR